MSSYSQDFIHYTILLLVELFYIYYLSICNWQLEHVSYVHYFCHCVLNEKFAEEFWKTWPVILNKNTVKYIQWVFLVHFVSFSYVACETLLAWYNLVQRCRHWKAFYFFVTVWSHIMTLQIKRIWTRTLITHKSFKMFISVYQGQIINENQTLSRMIWIMGM